MSQHLYPCELCGRHGVAHYILVPQDDEHAPWRNMLLCTGCWTEYREEMKTVDFTGAIPTREWLRQRRAPEVRSSIGRAPVSKTGG